MDGLCRLAARRTYNASHGALLDGRPLWRVHDGLYDLGAFVSQHPGGAHWLELTRGSDITEAFEAHHPDIAAVRRILEKYRVGTADWPRESPLTFKEGEFYDVLRARIAKTVKEKGRWPKVWSKIIIDASVLGYLGLVFGAAKKKSYPMAALAGVLGGAIGVMAHNFLHQKDNWRMYYEELVAGSHETFRIHHALSHVSVFLDFVLFAN